MDDYQCFPETSIRRISSEDILARVSISSLSGSPESKIGIFNWEANSGLFLIIARHSLRASSGLSIISAQP